MTTSLDASGVQVLLSCDCLFNHYNVIKNSFHWLPSNTKEQHISIEDLVEEFSFDVLMCHELRNGTDAYLLMLRPPVINSEFLLMTYPSLRGDLFFCLEGLVGSFQGSLQMAVYCWDSRGMYPVAPGNLFHFLQGGSSHGRVRQLQEGLIPFLLVFRDVKQRPAREPILQTQTTGSTALL
jgi:hypothetical protein